MSKGIRWFDWIILGLLTLPSVFISKILLSPPFDAWMKLFFVLVVTTHIIGAVSLLWVRNNLNGIFKYASWPWILALFFSSLFISLFIFLGVVVLVPALAFGLILWLPCAYPFAMMLTGLSVLVVTKRLKPSSTDQGGQQRL